MHQPCLSRCRRCWHCLSLLPWPALTSVLLLIPGVIVWAVFANKCTNSTFAFFNVVTPVAPDTLAVASNAVYTTLVRACHIAGTWAEHKASYHAEHFSRQHMHHYYTARCCTHPSAQLVEARRHQKHSKVGIQPFICPDYPAHAAPLGHAVGGKHGHCRHCPGDGNPAWRAGARDAPRQCMPLRCVEAWYSCRLLAS